MLFLGLGLDSIQAPLGSWLYASLDPFCGARTSPLLTSFLLWRYCAEAGPPAKARAEAVLPAKALVNSEPPEITEPHRAPLP